MALKYLYRDYCKAKAHTICAPGPIEVAITQHRVDEHARRVRLHKACRGNEQTGLRTISPKMIKCKRSSNTSGVTLNPKPTSIDSLVWTATSHAPGACHGLFPSLRSKCLTVSARSEVSCSPLIYGFCYLSGAYISFTSLPYTYSREVDARHDFIRSGRRFASLGVCFHAQPRLWILSRCCCIFSGVRSRPLLRRVNSSWATLVNVGGMGGLNPPEKRSENPLPLHLIPKPCKP